MNVNNVVAGQGVGVKSVKKLTSKTKASSLKSVTSEVVTRNVQPPLQNSNVQAQSSFSIFPEANSLRDFVDLSQDMNRKVGLDKQENQLQTIFNLNDITALETSHGFPTGPDLFSHAANLQTPSVGRSESMQQTNRNENLQLVGSRRIPQPSSDTFPVIYPFNVIGSADRVPPINPNSPDEVWVGATNSIINTRNSPPLHQNSNSLSPNQELHKAVSHNKETENIENVESMLLNTDMESLRPRNSQTEKVDTGSFGLSLLNKNIAQLVNGLSRNITRPGRIALGEDIKHKAKPIRGIIVGNPVEQENNESKQQPSNNDQQIVPQKRSSKLPSLTGLGQVHNLFDTSAHQFELLTPQVMNGLSTGNKVLLEGASAPVWIQSNNQNSENFGMFSSHLPQQSFFSGSKFDSGKMQTNTINNAGRSTTTNKNNKFDATNSNIVSTSGNTATPFDSNMFPGLGTSEQSFNTRPGVLNKQNMGFMRNGLQETANSKNSNPAIGDTGIAQLINNVVSRVDQNSIQQSTIAQRHLGTNNNFRRSRTTGQNNFVPQNTFQNGRFTQMNHNNPNQITRMQSENNFVNTRNNLQSHLGLSNNARSGFRQNPRANIATLPRNRITRPADIANTVGRRGRLPSSQTTNIRSPVRQNTRNQNSRFNSGRQHSRATMTSNAGNSRQIPANTISNNPTSRSLKSAPFNVRNNNGQSLNAFPSNINSVRQLPTNVNQGTRQIRDIPTIPIDLRTATRRIQDGRATQNIPQTSRNVIDLSRPASQIAALVVNLNNRESNALGQSNIFRVQNSSSSLRNRNVLNRLLQAIDMPKNLPQGQILMIYPRGAGRNSTLNRAGNSRFRLSSALRSQLENLLSQRWIKNGRTQSANQRSSGNRQMVQNQRRGNRGSNVRVSSQPGTQVGLNNHQSNVLQQIMNNLEGRSSQPVSLSQGQSPQTAFQTLVRSRGRSGDSGSSLRQQSISPNTGQRTGTQTNRQWNAINRSQSSVVRNGQRSLVF